MHSVVRDIFDRARFESFLSESGRLPSPGASYFDSFLGAALLSTCAPVLDLPSTSSAEEYLERRFELGGKEANERLLRAADLEELLVDHGFRGADLVEPDELAALSRTRVRAIVRLELVAEEIFSLGRPAREFAELFSDRLAAELQGPDGAVGTKSVLAYRHGFDVDPAEPTPTSVVEAVEEWRRQEEQTGSRRLDHPVVLRHLVWVALRAGVPLQFHTGYGDTDLDLHRSNPLLLTPFVRVAADLGTPVMLLHCYPFHREAAYLAGVFPEVYIDVGLAVNYAGHRARDVLAEALETAPFHTVLYSSDAFGLAELHYMAAVRFREMLHQVLEPLGSFEGRSEAEIARYVEMIGSGNARRAYGLGAAP